MKFEIKNRLTGAVQVTTEIECDEDASYSLKLGLAVKWAIKAGANLAGANLAGAYLADAYLADANLADANLAGAYLADANLAGANLADANLAGANLAGANLADANLAGAYLADANLARANLAGANLAGAYLADAYLAGANLQSPLPIPKIPDIDKAVYEAVSQPGALDMGVWHNACGTAHCRAGWVVTLAGPEGKALEERHGTPLAALMIHRESGSPIAPARFYDSDEDAMEDMRKRAEASA